MSKKLGKPESHSEVINKEPKVLLIGYGWVGQYCGAYFKEAHYTNASNKVYNQKHEEIEPYELYDMAIIGVPTPMNEDGSCDTSIVEDVVINNRHRVKHFLCKSTVAIGTCDSLSDRYGVSIAMSPEYVGETLGHPLTEPSRNTFIIIGGNDATVKHIAEYWRLVLHANSKIILTTALEAEIIKYSENYWITRRVDYWNDIYDICGAFNVSFDRVREGLLADPRLGRTHSFVYPNNRGWGGKCLPKDMGALAYTMDEMQKPLTSLKQMISKNIHYWRKDYNEQEELKILERNGY